MRFSISLGGNSSINRVEEEGFRNGNMSDLGGTPAPPVFIEHICASCEASWRVEGNYEKPSDLKALEEIAVDHFTRRILRGEAMSVIENPVVAADISRCSRILDFVTLCDSCINYFVESERRIMKIQYSFVQKFRGDRKFVDVLRDPWLDLKKFAYHKLEGLENIITERLCLIDGMLPESSSSKMTVTNAPISIDTNSATVEYAGSASSSSSSSALIVTSSTPLKPGPAQTKETITLRKKRNFNDMLPATDVGGDDDGSETDDTTRSAPPTRKKRPALRDSEQRKKSSTTVSTSTTQVDEQSEEASTSAAAPASPPRKRSKVKPAENEAENGSETDDNTRPALTTDRKSSTAQINEQQEKTTAPDPTPSLVEDDTAMPFTAPPPFSTPARRSKGQTREGGEDEDDGGNETDDSTKSASSSQRKRTSPRVSEQQEKKNASATASEKQPLLKPSSLVFAKKSVPPPTTPIKSKQIPSLSPLDNPSNKPNKKSIGGGPKIKPPARNETSGAISSVLECFLDDNDQMVMRPKGDNVDQNHQDKQGEKTGTRQNQDKKEEKSGTGQNQNKKEEKSGTGQNKNKKEEKTGRGQHQDKKGENGGTGQNQALKGEKPGTRQNQAKKGEKAGTGKLDKKEDKVGPPSVPPKKKKTRIVFEVAGRKIVDSGSASSDSGDSSDSEGELIIDE